MADADQMSVVQSVVMTESLLRWQCWLISTRWACPRRQGRTSDRRCPDPIIGTDGPAEFRLGLQAHSGELLKVGPGRRLNDPADTQKAARPSRAGSKHRSSLAAGSAMSSVDDIGLRLFSTSTALSPAPILRVLRRGDQHPVRPCPQRHQQSRRSLNNAAGPQPTGRPRRTRRVVPAGE